MSDAPAIADSPIPVRSVAQAEFPSARPVGDRERNCHERRRTLTPRQQQMEFIDQAGSVARVPAGAREIGAAVGLSSSSRSTRTLWCLQDKGYLRRDPRSRCAIEVCFFEPGFGRGRRPPAVHVARR